MKGSENGQSRQIAVRWPRDLLAQVEQAATLHGCTVSAELVQLVREALDARSRPIVDVSAEALARLVERERYPDASE